MMSETSIVSILKSFSSSTNNLPPVDPGEDAGGSAPVAGVEVKLVADSSEQANDSHIVIVISNLSVLFSIFPSPLCYAKSMNQVNFKLCSYLKNSSALSSFGLTKNNHV